MWSAEWLGEVVPRGRRRVRASTDLPLKFRNPHSALRIRRGRPPPPPLPPPPPPPTPGGGETASREFRPEPASGSAKTAGMVICPCSMGTVAAIAHGTSRSLIERAADVVLKERRRLILVPRETPLSLVHLRNLTLATEAGAVVLPAAPGFYHKPQQVRDLVDFVVQRVLDHLGLDINLVKRWEGK